MVTSILSDLRAIAREQGRNRNRGAHNRHGGIVTITTIKSRRHRRRVKAGLVRWLRGETG
jgi:hypothetical protein